MWRRDPSPAEESSRRAQSLHWNMLLRMSQQFPRQEILVLCNHTHSAATVRIIPNLTIRSGAARPGFPSLGETISLASEFHRIA